MVLDRDLRFVEMNEAYLDTTQTERESLIGRYVFDVFPEHGERLERFHRAFRAALDGEANELMRVPFSIRRPDSEGGGLREVWWTCAHVPVCSEDGTVEFVVQNARDVTDEVEAQRLKDLIAGELQHRVANLLSVITVIARRTAEHENSIKDFLNSFTARIRSLGQTHSLLTGGNWSGTGMAELVAQHLEAYAGDGHHIEIKGPELRFSASEAQSVSMALHELATNAVKYGALKNAKGRLNVTWDILEPGGYRLEWREEGLEGVTEPERTGFGSMILTTILPSQLGGEAQREFSPTGHVYRLNVPRRKSMGDPADDREEDHPALVG